MKTEVLGGQGAIPSDFSLERRRSDRQATAKSRLEISSACFFWTGNERLFKGILVCNVDACINQGTISILAFRVTSVDQFSRVGRARL